MKAQYQPQVFPDAFELVASGELQLSVLAALAKYLTAENVSELFEVCRRRSIRRVEELIAGRFPAPDVRDSVRRLPERRSAAGELGSAGAATTSCAEGEPVPLVPSGEMPQRLPRSLLPSLPAVLAAGSPRGQVEPLSADRFAVRFTADAELLDLLEAVRALASHRNPTGDLLSTVKAGLDAYRRELQAVPRRGNPLRGRLAELPCFERSHRAKRSGALEVIPAGCSSRQRAINVVERIDGFVFVRYADTPARFDLTSILSP